MNSDHYQAIDYLALILKLQKLFHNEDLSIKIGFEIEFYLEGDSSDLEDFVNQNITNAVLTNEDGMNQFELIFTESTDIIGKILEATEAKTLLQTRYNKVSFLTKPFENRPCSGINISISLWRKEINLYAKAENSKFTKEFIHSISGLEDLANDLILLYVWSDDGMQRFSPSMHNPSKICWGINNRTAAFRVPSLKPLEARIENRLIASSSNIAAASFATIFSIYYGIKNKKILHHKIYGVAHNDQYELVNLVKNFDEAKFRFNSSKLIDEFV